jgi:hypothetical protein
MFPDESIVTKLPSSSLGPAMVLPQIRGPVHIGQPPPPEPLEALLETLLLTLLLALALLDAVLLVAPPAPPIPPAPPAPPEPVVAVVPPVPVVPGLPPIPVEVDVVSPVALLVAAPPVPVVLPPVVPEGESPEEQDVSASSGAEQTANRAARESFFIMVDSPSRQSCSPGDLGWIRAASGKRAEEQSRRDRGQGQASLGLPGVP